MYEVTIGIPSYNEEKNIQNLLESIIDQYHESYILKEIIISDDSFDKTPEIIQKFAKNHPNYNIKLIHHNKRRGASMAWNEIFQEATGQIIVLYDADIKLEKKCTFNLINKISSNTVLSASNPQPLQSDNIYGNASKFISSWLRKVRQNGLSQYTVMGRALAIKTEIAKKIYIPEDIIAIDLYLQNQILRLNHKIIYIDDAIVYYNTPSSLHDFISQVIRADNGHHQISSKYVKLPFWNNIIISLKCFIVDPLGALSVVYCYSFIPYFKMTNSKEFLKSKWNIANSTK
ncbi:MAG: glycosyltransferase [Nitrososphaeraceae archaeon]